MPDLINLKIFKHFLQSNNTGGMLLFICVIVSMIIANTPLAMSFNNLLNTTVGFETEHIHLNYSILLWINDGLMAIFFLLVGLEIKRELIEGELSSPKKALLPILAAVGGAILPALIYLFINKGLPTEHGWGIPMATDIAFALAVITLLGKRVPASLKIFLAALAIVDDLLAILVIALFYSGDLHYSYLFTALGILAFLLLLNFLGVKKIWAYLIPGIFIWYFIHHSGIHATIAGVLVALTLPTNTTDDESPLEKLEHILTSPVNFIIIPLFAIANTNLTIHSEMVGGLTTALGVGIIGGLLVGKSVGILGISYIATTLKICTLPEGASWKHIFGVGLLGGIGFTMSIFVSILAFTDPMLIEEAKFAVLVGSLFSGAIGYLFLASIGNKKQYDTNYVDPF